MKIRRLVTGHSAEGKAIVAADTEVEGLRLAALPGVEYHQLWGGDQAPTFPDGGLEPEHRDYFPTVGGFRFVIATVAPESETPTYELDEAAAMEELDRVLPGLAATLEPDDPGMHTTDTIDFFYVISGEVRLELDDGRETSLRAGDTGVQNGTRHRWRNTTAKPCRMLFVTVGAHRTSPPPKAGA
ncbi:MAG: cupin domain-containing protein [bacterium]|nr:cupin domain-containing protein [bacterium]